MTIITPTYKQIKKLDMLRDAIKDWDADWVLAIDGCEKTKKWADREGIEYVYHARKDRRYNEICNKASKGRDGYLLFISGDSVPHEGYLEAMMEVAEKNRIVCGMRVNKDENGKILSSDHRWEYYDTPQKKPFKITGKNPWEKQTSNGMLIHSDLWKTLNGFDEVYKGYGVVDQDLCMRAWYKGNEMWWQPQAILDHHDIKFQELNKENYEIYNDRKNSY